MTTTEGHLCSTENLQLHGKTRAQHLSLCEQLRIRSASDFPAKVLTDTKRTTRHQSLSVRVAQEALSPAAFLHCIWQKKHVTPSPQYALPCVHRTEQQRSVRSVRSHTKSPFFTPQPHKRSTQRASVNAVTTCHGRFRQPP